MTGFQLSDFSLAFGSPHQDKGLFGFIVRPCHTTVEAVYETTVLIYIKKTI